MSDIDPKNEVFTRVGMKLPYKGPLSKQWVAKAMANTGFNFFRPGRFMSEIVLGTNPVPPDGDESAIDLHIAVSLAVVTPVEIDVENDFRDRSLTFIGMMTEDSASYQYGTSTMKDATADAGIDGSDSDRMVTISAAAGVAMTIGSGNTGPGGVANDCSIGIREGGVLYTARFYADASDGHLFVDITAPGSLTNKLSIYGVLHVSPKMGHKDT